MRICRVLFAAGSYRQAFSRKPHWRSWLAAERFLWSQVATVQEKPWSRRHPACSNVRWSQQLPYVPRTGRHRLGTPLRSSFINQQTETGYQPMNRSTRSDRKSCHDHVTMCDEWRCNVRSRSSVNRRRRRRHRKVHTCSLKLVYSQFRDTPPPPAPPPPQVVTQPHSNTDNDDKTINDDSLISRNHVQCTYAIKISSRVEAERLNSF